MEGMEKKVIKERSAPGIVNQGPVNPVLPPRSNLNGESNRDEREASRKKEEAEIVASLRKLEESTAADLEAEARIR